MNYKVICKLILIYLLIIFHSNIYSWGSLTHYYIGKMSINSNESYNYLNEIFNYSNMSPDMFASLSGFNKQYYNWAHAPYPRNIYNINDPNFAYIMTLIGKSSIEKNDIALGWGSHIVADWVAHGKYFTIEGSAKKTMLELS